MSPRTKGTAGFPAGDRPSLAALGAPLQPQVNLLPPEIRSRRALGRAKVGLAFVLAGVILLVALGYVYASLTENRAANELAAAEDEVLALQAQQSRYSEVPQVKGQIAAARQARELSMSTEVLWPDYIRAIQAVTPEGVSLSQLSTEMPSPTVGMSLSTSPLDAAGVGAITFNGTSRTLPDLAGWMDALDAIPGFASATYTTAELTDQEGVVVYQIAAAVRLEESVFASRFLATDEEE